MSGRIAVHSPLAKYRVAAAELPLGTRLAAEGTVTPGSVAIVPGDGPWWEGALAAASAGAAAIIVSRPASAASGVLADLADRIHRPLVLDRALLQPDVTDRIVRAGAPSPSAIVVECHAPAPSLRAALVDAIGWARVVAVGPLSLRAASGGGRRGIALLDASAGPPVSLVYGEQPEAAALGRVRLTALGITLVEVEASETGSRVTMTDADGARTAPTAFESPERHALRRAVDAVERGGAPVDLADLRHDTELAEAVAAASIA